jgi:perosamine synthetase
LIPINKPSMDEAEVQAVVEVLRKGPVTNALGAGPKVLEFEKTFAEFVGAKHAVAVNTGTAALHSALMAVGVKRDDEVIVPSFTFVATAEAVALASAKPVFTDINPETYTLSPEAVEKALTKKTKAILPVDLYGFSADIMPLVKIAKKNGLGLVEDAAQAHGATYAGKPVGSFSDAACWSLYASKNMMTGEGGIVTTNDDVIDERLRMIRTHGERAKYSSEMLGSNYRMPEIEAAIGLVQLKKLSSFVAKRRENAQQLTNILLKSKKLDLPYETKTCRHSWYLYTVRLIGATEAQRNKLIDDLKAKGIGAEAYYLHPINTMPYYRDNFRAKALPETKKAATQVFSLPIHPSVTKEEIEFIGETVLRLI